MRPSSAVIATDLPLAILTICAGVGFLVGNDAVAKLLTDRYDPIQIILVRNMLALPMVAALVVALRGSQALRTRHLRLHALRGLLMMIGAWLYFSSLQYLPLAEATALVFSAPIFITALSVPILGESVGWRRWGAVLLGFAGVLIIVQPGTAAFQPASIMVLGTAVLYAVFMILARFIDRGESMWTMMFFVMLFPGIYAAPFAWAVWTPVLAADWPMFVLLAICGSLGITLIGQAFRLAPAAVVAPFDYTALIWAAGLGFLIWGDLPGAWTLVGAGVIVCSGLIIVFRETRQR